MTTYTPPVPTYTPLQTITLGSSASSVTFSNIPNTYRDLVLICNTSGTGNNIYLQFNNDTSTSNYVYVFMRGRSSGTDSAAYSSDGAIYSATAPSNTFVNETQIMDYSATDKHKTVLMRDNNATQSYVDAVAGRWASTSAITTVKISNAGGSFGSGSTFSLFGIAA